MPQSDFWFEYFKKAVDSIALSFKGVFPENIDQERITEIEDRINGLWLSPDATVDQFKQAVGDFRMEFFKCLKSQK